jgi:hypothetical protein
VKIGFLSIDAKNFYPHSIKSLIATNFNELKLSGKIMKEDEQPLK